MFNRVLHIELHHHHHKHTTNTTSTKNGTVAVIHERDDSGKKRRDGCVSMKSLARRRSEEACEFAGHIETITQLHLDTIKTSFVAYDFDAKVVSPKKLRPLADTLQAKSSDICEKLTETSLLDDDWTRFGWAGYPSGNLAAGSLFHPTTKKTRAHTERIKRPHRLTGIPCCEERAWWDRFVTEPKT